VPTYFAIFTTVGLERLAEAQASGTPLVFVDVAVGDGGGSEITPLASMTALVNETARVTVNNVDIAPGAPTTVRVEGLIPAATGGFTIREAGLFNGAGELIAIASYPPIYKPVPADGVSIEEYIRILLVYEETTAIALTVDTSVVTATTLYVDERDGVIETEIDLLDARVAVIESLLAGGLIIWDQFTGSEVDAGKWDVINGAPSTDGDSAAGGFGAVVLDEANIATDDLALGTEDFHLAARLRVTSPDANTVLYFGLGIGGPGGAEGLFFYATGAVSTTLWRTMIDTVSTAPNGTAAAIDDAYQVFEIIRVDNVVTFKVDGVIHHEIESYTEDLTGANLYIEHAITSGGTMPLDWVFLTTGTPFVSSVGGVGHIESGYFTVSAYGAGLEYEVEFDTPFENATGANGYEFDVTISYAEDPYEDLIGWRVVEKTVNGFVIKLTDDNFLGEIRWKARR
jgi:hypothetical protein